MRALSFLFAAAALLSITDHAVAAPLVLAPMYGGRIEHPSLHAVFVPTVYLPDWSGRSGNGSFETVWTNGTTRFEIPLSDSDAPLLRGMAKVIQTDPKTLRVGYAFKAVADSDIALFCVTANFPLRAFAGGRAEADGQTCAIPLHMPERPMFFSGASKTLRLYDAEGALRLDLVLPEKHAITLQDSRRWHGDSFSMRVEIPPENRLQIRIGDSYKFAMTLRDEAGLEFDNTSGVQIEKGPDWVPMRVCENIREGSALDFTAVRCTDMPAGRHGYVVSKGDHFEFEDSPGVPRRFYGINVVGDANIPTYDESLRFAEHIRRSGYNSVRLHHHEMHLVKKDSRGALELDEDAMRRFDGLVYACISNGLYISTDLFVSRRPISYESIGIDRPGNVSEQEFKELVMLHEGAMSNYLAWARVFLGHRNFYTGRRYADEPALSFLSLVNEGNFGNVGMRYMSQHPVFAERWSAWLREKKSKDGAAWGAIPETLPKSMNDGSDAAAAYAVFVQELDAAFARRVTSFLRDEMKCRALTTNLNGWTNPIGYSLSRAREYDYVDDHYYVDHPKFNFGSWQWPMGLDNVNTIGLTSSGMPEIAPRRVYGKPFTISEWNHSAPGSFRGAGGLLFGAAAASQDWGGLWRFAWSHGAAGMRDFTELPTSAFDVCSDPLMVASERVGVSLFLRRDLEPISRKLAMVLPPDELSRPAPGNADWSFSATGLGWYARIGQYVGEADEIEADVKSVGIAGYKGGFAHFADRVCPGSQGGTQLSDVAGDGELRLNRRKGLFSVDTPATVGAFVESGNVRVGSMSVRVEDAPATVFAIALDGKPIGESDRLLVSHLTDVQDVGTAFCNKARTLWLRMGSLPHLMRRGKADISLSVGLGNWSVHALATDGSRRFKVPFSQKGKTVSFTADIAVEPNEATYLYELCKEP